MAASDSLRLIALPLRTLAFGAVGAVLTAVGTVAGDSVRILEIHNLTDQDLIGSQFGTADNFMLPSGAGMIIDVTANRTNTVQGVYLSSNTWIYVRHQGVAPTLGAVWVTYWVADDR